MLKVLGVRGIPKYPKNGDYPSHIDTVASMIGLEANLDVSDEDLKDWNETIVTYFRGGGVRVKTSVVFSVSDVLNLKN